MTRRVALALLVTTLVVGFPFSAGALAAAGQGGVLTHLAVASALVWALMFFYLVVTE